MVGCPHPHVLTTVAAQRYASIQAEADRERLGRLIPPNADRRWQAVDLFTAPVLGVVLALLVAASRWS